MAIPHVPSRNPIQEPQTKIVSFEHLSVEMDPNFLFLDDGDLSAFMANSWDDQPLAAIPLPISTLGCNTDDQSWSVTPSVELENDTIAETMSLKPAKQSKTERKRRRDRNRAYREIPQLRTQIIDLENKLEEERLKASKQALGALSGRAQNIILKTKLSKNHEWMQTIEKILGEQMHEVVHVLPHSGFITVRVLQYDEEDVSTFRELANNVDDQYEHTNRVLQLSGLHEATSEMVDAYICRSEGASSDLLKFCTCMLVPYEAHALERAVWENLKKDEVVVLGPKQTVEALTLPLGMASRLTVQKYEVILDDFTCTMTMVLKQFIEKDRLVHVWHTNAEWKSGCTASNIKTHEYGWSLARPIEGTAASVWQSCVLMSPVLTGLTPSERCETTQLLARLYQDFIVWRLQFLENQVIDDSILKKKSTHSEGISAAMQ